MIAIAKFFHPIYLGTDGGAETLLGNAFPVTRDGGLLTCRHVVDVVVEGDRQVMVHDSERDRLTPVGRVVYAEDGLDLAFIPDAWGRPKAEFIPILTPEAVLIGSGVYSFGQYALGGRADTVRSGYFSGSIVAMSPRTRDGRDAPELTLPYAVIEGMSGSPVLSYHNGTKLVGICHGNEAQRILASEIVDIDSGGSQFRETVHRQVEFGLAYHCATIVRFLESIGVRNFVASEGRVDAPGLE